MGLLLLYITLPLSIAAQSNSFETKESQISNVEFYTSNYGIFGLDIANTKSGFHVPRGSDKNYLFGSGLWFGAKKTVSKDGGTTYEEAKLSFITYNPNSGRSWATPGEFFETLPRSKVLPIVYHSIEHNQETGQMLNGNGFPWWPLASKPGEQVTPLNPGHFSLDGGAAFMPGVDEQFFSYYSDNTLSQYEVGATQAQALGFPIGLQIQQNVYAWKPGDLRENVVVLQYEIENVSNKTLRDCYIAQTLDPDIGAAANDRASFYSIDPLLHAGIVWSEQSAGDQDYGTLAIIMLEAPVVDGDGFVNNSNRALFRSSGEVHSFINWIVDTEPHTVQERYDFLAYGKRDRDIGPGDKRVLIGTEPFNMAPGDKAHFAIALAVLEGVRPNVTEEEKENEVQTEAIPELESLSKTLHQEYYETHFQTSSVEDNRTQELTAQLWPNPTSTEATIHMILEERADVSIQVIDNLGREVHVLSLTNRQPGPLSHRLDLERLESGSYVVSVKAGNYHKTMQLSVVR